MAAALEEGVVHADDAAHRPQPAAPLRHVVQGRHRAPDARTSRSPARSPSRATSARCWSSEKMPPQTIETTSASSASARESGVGYPGESAGLLAKPEDWSGSQRYTSCSGRATRVNAIQAAGVFQTIANGGVRVAPEPGREHHRRRRHGRRPPRRPRRVRVVSKDTATKTSARCSRGSSAPTAPAQRRRSRATASPARPARRTAYDAAAAATAASPRRFIGYAPADDPQYVVAVIAAEADPAATSAGARRAGVQGRHDLRAAGGADPAHRLGRPGDPAQVSADAAWDPNDPAVAQR